MYAGINPSTAAITRSNNEYISLYLPDRWHNGDFPDGKNYCKDNSTISHLRCFNCGLGHFDPGHFNTLKLLISKINRQFWPVDAHSDDMVRSFYVRTILTSILASTKSTAQIEQLTRSLMTWCGSKWPAPQCRKSMDSFCPLSLCCDSWWWPMWSPPQISVSATESRWL